MPRSRRRSRKRSHHAKHHVKHHTKRHHSKKHRKSKRKSKRKLNGWQMLVKKTLKEGKRRDPNYNLANALKDAKKVYRK